MSQVCKGVPSYVLCVCVFMGIKYIFYKYKIYVHKLTRLPVLVYKIHLNNCTCRFFFDFLFKLFSKSFALVCWWYYFLLPYVGKIYLKDPPTFSCVFDKVDSGHITPSCLCSRSTLGFKPSTQ